MTRILLALALLGCSNNVGIDDDGNNGQRMQWFGPRSGRLFDGVAHDGEVTSG